MHGGNHAGWVRKLVGRMEPVELRMRLDAALAEIAELREENDRLRQLLRQQASVERGLIEPDRISAVPGKLSQNGLPYADAASPPSEKLALFKALFVGRRDVYATRFFSRKTGRHGWSPAEKEFWRKRDDAEREFLPLADKVLIAHLSRSADGRDSHVGLYPMLPDDTCQLLACDFDGAGWQGDATAYAEACTRAGIHKAGGDLPVRRRRPRVDVLHRARPGRFGTCRRHGTVAGGDRPAGDDVAGQL